jgi:peptidyl-prolyl cis-trans isomerase A (cyclophilin A)
MIEPRSRVTVLRGSILVVLAVLGAATGCAEHGVQRHEVSATQAQSRAVEVVMATSIGDITIELYPQQAPITVANFLRHVDEERYAGGRFYRTVRADNDRNPKLINVIQGGIQESAAPLPPIAHETTQATGLRHIDGAISMARGAPGTASSEFFICIGDNPNLDFGALRNADGQGFAAFGGVVAGMDVVRRIHAASANAPTDEPYVRGQILDQPVEIRSVRRSASR